jgi:hypothetical protein
MVNREAQSEVITLMQEFPAVGLLGPHQVGKTTLAETIAVLFSPEPILI